MRLRRSLLAAGAAFALAASTVFGHEMPDAAADGLATAMAAAEKFLPVGQVQEVADEQPDETTDETMDETVDTEVVEPASHEEDDGHCLDWSEGVPEVEEGDEPNHGAYVCGAAHADWQAEGFAEMFGLDADFRNRGEWMRWVAQRNYEDVDADADEDAVASADKEKGNKGKGKGNADRGRGKGRPR